MVKSWLVGLHIFTLKVFNNVNLAHLLYEYMDKTSLSAFICSIAEVGDYHPEDHPQGYVSEFKMLPKQNAKMEAEIMEIHKSLT